MLLDEELVAKIKKLARNRINSRERRDSFFSKAFKKFPDKDKAKIISIFSQADKHFYHYVNINADSESKANIINFCESGVNNFYSSDNIEETKSYFDSINLYLNLDDIDFNDNSFYKIIDKLNIMLKEDSISLNDDLTTELLTNFIKFASYSNFNSEELATITNSKSYTIVKDIIINYIDNLEISGDSLNDDFLMLLLETRNLVGFSKINEKLASKGNNNNLDSFSEYIKKDTIVDSNKFNDFCHSILSYKLSYSILPKEFCIYLFKFYKDNNKLSRISSIDLIRHYLIENNIYDTIIFNDSLLFAPGMASKRYMALRYNELSTDNFHEATHVIQYNQVFNNTNFTNYRYDVLKDLLIKENITWNNYCNNHANFSFEIDADIQGGKQFGILMLNTGQDVNEIEQQMASMDKIEQRRINESKTLRIDNVEVDKKELFDDIIKKHPSYIKKYPVLAIEYNADGSKKNNDEILSTLKSYKLNHVYSDEELSAIESCIFDKTLENKKTI